MKKALSLLLVLAMILAVAPAVFAEDTGDGSIDNPYIYESVDELVAEWTEKEIGGGEIIYVQAPLGGETLTVTSDTTAACIVSIKGAGLAYDGEAYTFSAEVNSEWTDGCDILIGIYNQNPFGAAVVTLTAASNDGEVSGDGSIGDPYVYGSIDALVADWTEKTVAGGEVIYVQAPLGGEVLTITSDTTAACIMSPRGNILAYDSEPCAFTDYEEGMDILIGIYNQNPGGDAVVTLTAGSASEDEYAFDLGTVSNYSTSGEYTYTSMNAWIGTTYDFVPAADGTVTVEFTAVDPGYYIALYDLDNGELLENQYGGSADSITYDVSAGVEYQLQVSSAMYYGANLAWADAGSISYTISIACGSSDENDDPYSGTVELEDGEDYVEILYTPESDGTLSIEVSGNPGWQVTIEAGYSYECYWSDCNDSPIETEVTEGTTYTICIYAYDPELGWGGATCEGTVTYALTLTPAAEDEEPTEGTVVDSGYASADEDSKKVILYTPAADGTLTITVGDGTAAWVSDVMNFSNYSTTEKVTGTDEASYTVEVKAGVTYAVRIYGQGDPCAAISDIPYTIVFNGEQAEETIDGTTVTLNTATYGDELEVPVEVTGSGTITIAICGDPGYRFWLKDANGNYLTNGITGKEAQTYTYDFTAAGEYSVVIQSYDKAGWGEGDGTVTYDISFAAGEVEVQVDKYVISGELALGENAVEMAENAENTLFMFTPEETGVYTFTGVDLSNWHTSFNPYITEGETPAATIEWTCTEVGQHVLIGITASGTITVEKTGEYVPSAELTMDWVEYDLENEAKEYVPATGANVVELKDSDTIVLGKDGYYHYGTANGPLVVIDLSADGELGISIIEAMANGRVGAYIYDENGTLIAKYDYGNTLVELQETGMTLLTDEILSIVKAVGYNSGWWTYMGIQDNENPWLVLCAYVEGTETPDANPATGDVIIAGAVIALMTSATGLVVTKKKFF